MATKRSRLQVRNLKLNDIETICDIVKGSTRDFHEKPQVQKIVERNGEVVGYATLKLIAEIVMILDSGLSVRDKAESLALLMESAQDEAQKLGSEYIYMCTSDENYAKLIEKHYGFQLMKGHYFLRRKVK